MKPKAPRKDKDGRRVVHKLHKHRTIGVDGTLRHAKDGMKHRRGFAGGGDVGPVGGYPANSNLGRPQRRSAPSKTGGKSAGSKKGGSTVNVIVMGKHDGAGGPGAGPGPGGPPIVPPIGPAALAGGPPPVPPPALGGGMPPPMAGRGLPPGGPPPGVPIRALGGRVPRQDGGKVIPMPTAFARGGAVEGKKHGGGMGMKEFDKHEAEERREFAKCHKAGGGKVDGGYAGRGRPRVEGDEAWRNARGTRIVENDESWKDVGSDAQKDEAWEAAKAGHDKKAAKPGTSRAARARGGKVSIGPPARTTKVSYPSLKGEQRTGPTEGIKNGATKMRPFKSSGDLTMKGGVGTGASFLKMRHGAKTGVQAEARRVSAPHGPNDFPPFEIYSKDSKK